VRCAWRAFCAQILARRRIATCIEAMNARRRQTLIAATFSGECCSGGVKTPPIQGEIDERQVGF
jgi:hypothetical protein